MNRFQASLLLMDCDFAVEGELDEIGDDCLLWTGKAMTRYLH
jgi:hypothetical protein